MLAAQPAAGYAWQACDSFAWSLVIGSTVTELATTDTPSYAWDSPARYNAPDMQIRLRVTNVLGSDERSASLPMRGLSCASAPIPAAAITLRGTESGCTELSDSCVQTEPIAFSVNFVTSRTTPCAQFTWTWGDGTTTSARDLTSATHAYGPVGTFTPSVSIIDGTYNASIVLRPLVITAKAVVDPPHSRARAVRH